MKNYQKAEMIAKNLPTGSYAAGCPTGICKEGGQYYYSEKGEWMGPRGGAGCVACEVAG